MRNLISLLIITTIITGCQYSPYADKYTVIEPTEKDVIGVYEFAFQTVDYSVDTGKIITKESIIIINIDKTYSVERLPYFKEVGLMTYRFDRQISFTGTWSIGTVGSVDFGNGNIKKHWGLYLDNAPTELENAGLLGVSKPNGIIFGFGDPDEGAVMTLNKK